MALLSFIDELARAEKRWPFSDGYEFESWSAIWCAECVHEMECPLLLVMLAGRTPQAWEDRNPGALNRYHCHEYQDVKAEENSDVAEGETPIL